MSNIKEIVRNLYMQLEIAKRNAETTEDEYEKVGYNYQIIGLNEKIDNAKAVLKSVFSSEKLEEIFKEILPPDVLAKANEDLAAKNEKSKNAYINYYTRYVKENEEKIQALITSRPTCVEEGDSKHREYLAYVEAKEKNQASLDNPTYKTYTLFEVLPNEYIDIAINKVSEEAQNLENVDEIADSINNFKPIGESEIGVTYPIKERLEEILSNRYLSPDYEKFLRDNKDLMNELTAVDSNANVNRMHGQYVKEIEAVVEKKNKQVFRDAVRGTEFEQLTNDTEFKADSPEELNKIYNDELNFSYSAETIGTFKRLLQEMNVRNFLPDQIELKEEGTKVYAFAKFAQARTNFINAVKATGDNYNPDIVKYTFEELVKETKKLEEMQETINKFIGTNFDAMPTNADIYRTSDIPRRFKQNAAHNAQMNNLYNVLVFLKTTNISIDEFLNNPADAVKKYVEEKSNQLNADNLVDGMNKGQAIFALADKDADRGLDPYGLMRTVEFLNNLETDPEKRKNNAIVSAGMMNAFGKTVFTIGLNTRYLNDSSSNIMETLQNIILAENEDGKILYSKCYAKNTPLNRIKTEDLDDGSEYVQEMTEANGGFRVRDHQTVLHKIAEIDSFEEKFYDAIAIIKQYDAARKDPKNANIKQHISVKDLVKATQELCVKYLYTHDVAAMNKEAKANGNDDIISEEFMTTMINFINNPSLESTLNGINVEGLGKPDLANIIKNKNSLMNAKGKAMTKAASDKEKDFITIFKDLNKQMDRLDKQVDKIASKIGKGETNEAIEAIGMQHRRLLNELMEAQNNKIEELKNDYEHGKITMYYYNKRVEQIKNLENLNNIPPLFEVDEPKYKDFKSYKKSLTNEEKSGKTDEDLKEEYKEVYNRLNSIKTVYLADHVLASKGIKAVKSLDGAKEFAAKIQLIDIKEEVYNELYQDIVKEKAIQEKLKREAEEKAKNGQKFEIDVPEASDEFAEKQLNNDGQSEIIDNPKKEINELIS